MALVVLDTTVLIDLLRGRSEATRRLASLRNAGDVPATCAINVEETVRGLRPAEHEPTRRLFQGLRIVPLGDREGWQAGEWRRRYASRGRTLTQGDCLVAAAALAAGGRLATANMRDFPMRELAVEHWAAGT